MSPVAPDIHRLSGAHMKGFAVLNLIAYIKDRYGSPALEQFYGELPASQIDPLRKGTIVSVAWVPLELYYAGVHFLVKRFHGGMPMAARQIGHDLASKDIGTIYRAVLRFASPTTVISLSARFWRDYFDKGTLKVHKLEKGRVRGEVSEFPFTDDITANEIGGSLLAWLEHSRARNVRLLEMGPGGPDSIYLDIAFE
jgi:hypothetical protein